MSSFNARIIPAAFVCSLLGLAVAHADRGKGPKKGGHRYHGAHPLSVRVEAGFCYIEVPHVHPSKIHKKHKPLYREHEGFQVFVADPFAYGFDGDRHNYYGHHPVAIDVILGDKDTYASGQQLEFCYIDGPHYHSFAPQAGLRFTQNAGASWYIGDFPESYVQGRATYAPVNRIYATIEVERPEVIFDAPPVGYVGPVVDVHVTPPHVDVVVDGPHAGVDVGGHGHGHGRGHAGVLGGIEIHLPTPTVEIGFGVNTHSHHDAHHKHKKHKVKKRKHKSKHKRRSRPHW